MGGFDIGIRKNVENDTVQYWLMIKAKAAAPEANAEGGKVKFKTIPIINLYVQVIGSPYWEFLIVTTVMMNIIYLMSYFWLASTFPLEDIIIIMHICCLLYWIDFIGAIVGKVFAKKLATNLKTRPRLFLILDAISLAPLSMIYLIAVEDINTELVWQLRGITAIRFYRIPWFFSQLSRIKKNHWIIVVFSCTCYMSLIIIMASNIFLYCVHEYSAIEIRHWNETGFNQIVVSLYYTFVLIFNVGYGDIQPKTYPQIGLTCVLMAVGTAMNAGVFTGILSNVFTQKGYKRELYRYEYEAIKKTLAERKINRKTTKEILSNMNMLWRYKKGNKSSPSVNILPSSLRKEIYFDINIVHLNRSLIFSMQPRSFLRSVALFMKNLTYLPGEIILEPSAMSDVMICIASGVIEVLSEENDESVLFSLTTGTILGEATLFIPLPIRCIIRASTYVELQVLMKVHFARLALTYPDIFKKMRADIFSRLKLKHQIRRSDSFRDIHVQERRKRRETKLFLQSLKNSQTNHRMDTEEGAILSLYTLSENIPRVKTLPVDLIRERPWIFRPNTPLRTLWDWLTILVVVFVAIFYPIWVAFYRKIQPLMYVLLTLAKAHFVIDVLIECLTAVERKDHFTFITSIREIIARKLKTFGFYLDILSMYYLSIYSTLVWPENSDYAYLLLSLNGLLKTWRVIVSMEKLKNDMKNNLLFIITVKYIIWIIFLITWAASLLYVEAKPGETFIEDRWFNQLEIEVIHDKDHSPRSATPNSVAFYYAAVTTFALGYGDIVPTAIPDCLTTMFCILAGYILVIVCVSETSAAIKHLARIKTTYQEELFAVGRFMSEHDIPKEYQSRVRNYLNVQWEYDKGYSLKQITVSEVLPGLQRRIITMELSKTFLTVPLFRKSNQGFLKVLAKLCKIRVLPPDEVVMSKNSFVRQMFILENGYCEISNDNERRVIGPLTPFGYVEMILGKQQKFDVKTLTHIRVVSLNYNSYLQAVTKYPEVKIDIEDNIKYYIDDREDILATSSSVNLESQNDQAIQTQFLTKPFINVYKYHRTTHVSYWEPFLPWGKCRIFQFFLVPISIHPNSTFLKIWMSLRILSALTVGTLAPVQFSLLRRSHVYMKIIIVLQVFAAVDMYLMFHVAYYDHRGLLMFHPSKTSTNYLKGSFILDLIAVFPFYWLLLYVFDNDEGITKFFINSSGLIMILQLYKFVQGCNHIEKNILRKTDVIKTIKLFPLVLLVINLITGLVILVQCYKLQSSMVSELQGSTDLAKELVKGIETFCLTSPKNKTEEESVYKLYVITLYWVTATITVCGFGDIWAHNETLMMFVIVIIVIGIFFFTFVFSNITSSMVNTNIRISHYRKHITKMTRFAKKENVSLELQDRLMLHYRYNWQRTEGESPQKIFAFVNSGLREEIVNIMYEETLSQNPAFKGLEKMLVSVIARHLEELYFLQGETIVKYKDIQDHIYLVYRGEVHLLKPKGGFILSMGRGGIFGNITNKPFLLSMETVMAAENTDLLKLDRKLFFSELQSIPNLSKFISYLTSRPENYIRATPKREIHDTINTTMKINILRIRSVNVDRMGAASVYLYQTGAFSLRKSVFFHRSKPCSTFVILPETMLNDVIELSFLIAAYISTILTTFSFAFQNYSSKILIMLYVVDVFFLFEIFLNFHRTRADRFGECMVDIKGIRKRYFKSKKLYLDLASNIPLEIFIFAASSKWRYKLLTILRLNRILRLHFVFQFYYKKQKSLMINKIYLQICWTIIMSVLMIHSLACIWFLVVCPLGYYQEPTWVTILKLKEKESWELYIYSVYHIITVITSTGLQALPIYSTAEVVLDILLMVTCRYVMVLLTALMTATINADNHNLFLFQQHILDLKQTFSRQSISSYQLDKMWSYLKNLWSSEIGKQMPEFLLSLPYTMKCEIMSDMFGSHLSQAYIFSRSDATFLRQLAARLKRFLYFPGTYIVQQGDIDYTMYFIHRGEVSVLTIHPELIETIHFTLTANDHFGFRQGLVIGKSHTFSYRAETNVEILSLTLSDWQILLKYYPGEAKHIYERLDTLPE